MQVRLSEIPAEKSQSLRPDQGISDDADDVAESYEDLLDKRRNPSVQIRAFPTRYDHP